MTASLHTVDRDIWSTRATRPCPLARGPAATGLGPDWSGVRDCHGRQAGLDGVEGADILRTRPTRAKGQRGVIGIESDDDHGHASDRDNSTFPVTA
jgi:hypothetical protein